MSDQLPAISDEANAALNELKLRISTMQLRARGRARRQKMGPWIRGWQRGMQDALGKVYETVETLQREGPRGGNDEVERPAPRKETL